MTQTPKYEKVKPGSDEEAFAKKALFKRHPIMPDWPKGRRACSNITYEWLL